MSEEYTNLEGKSLGLIHNRMPAFTQKIKSYVPEPLIKLYVLIKYRNYIYFYCVVLLVS